jgi:hypothetical protein
LRGTLVIDEGRFRLSDERADVVTQEKASNNAETLLERFFLALAESAMKCNRIKSGRGPSQDTDKVYLKYYAGLGAAR